jgi:hypothetical protein
MSGRSIAQILGWPEGATWIEPDVDQMIAWLRTNPNPRYVFQTISPWPSLTNFPDDYCSVGLCRDNRYSEYFHAETLRDALASAIRAVVGES